MSMLEEFSSAIALRDALLGKKVSAVEVADAALQRQQDTEPQLNCFTTCTPELAIGAALRADAALREGKPLGPLHGLPISVKDLIAVAGVRQTFGSRSMERNIAKVDAPVVSRIKMAGASIIGTTTTSEFGCKAVGDSPLTGITRNPWNTDKTPGGSSCGAAASVAAGVTPFALGTDGGGSVRAPASLTGLFGIKGQFGRVPVYPTSATPTLGHVGPLARNVRDAALLLSAIAGRDARDPFSVADPVPDFLVACDMPIKGMRLAWSPTFGYARPDPEIVRVSEAAMRHFEALGCEIVDLSGGIGADPVALWMAEFYAGVGTRLNSTLRENRHLLDQGVAAMLDGALDQTLLEYYQQVFERYQFRERMRALFESFDLLISPTLPVAAFDVGLDVPPEFGERNPCSWQFYTYPFNLSGQPAASLPVGFTTSGLPIGLQLVSRSYGECDIFRAAAAYEAAHQWSIAKPPGFHQSQQV